MAQLLDDPRRAEVQTMEVGSLFVGHAAPCVTVDTSESPVEISASKTGH